NQKGVVPVAAVVPQEIGGLTVVGYQQVEVPIVVDIGDGKRSTDLLHGEAAPCRTPSSTKRRPPALWNSSRRCAYFDPARTCAVLSTTWPLAMATSSRPSLS